MTTDYTEKGLGATWIDAGRDEDPIDDASSFLTGGGRSLPLAPPGRGGGSKPAPELSEGRFRASVESEKVRSRPRSDAELRELDIAKLEALDESTEGLNDWEAEAFPNMLDRLEKGRYPLTERQRAKVDEALDRLGLVVELPDVSGMR